MKFDNIDIIVSEIDGIITNGQSALDYLGYTPFKFYCNNDFEVINELKKMFTFVFVASDPAVSYTIMRSKNIPTYFVTNKENKLDILIKKIMPKYNMTPENLLYIGNSLSDTPCMNFAEISFSGKNSVNKVKVASNFVLETSSGKGVLCEVYDILLEEMKKRERKT